MYSASDIKAGEDLVYQLNGKRAVTGADLTACFLSDMHMYLPTRSTFNN
jgi:hypothetical protein